MFSVWHFFGCSFEDFSSGLQFQQDFSEKSSNAWVDLLAVPASHSRTKLVQKLECERGVNRRRWRVEELLATVDKLGGWKCQRGVSGAVLGEKLSF